MIESLYIKNFILVDEIEIQFEQGFNILTGETGAGKSIIVRAMSQLCGERGSPDLVRRDATKAVIEAFIRTTDSAGVNDFLRNEQIEQQTADTIILRKEIYANGASRIFINDSPVTLNRLTQLSALLVDLHGQHQHQRLLYPDSHLHYLDEFAGLTSLAEQFKTQLQAYRQALREYEQLKEEQLHAYQRQDMYRYQYDELSKAELKEGELDELKTEEKKLSNLENIHRYGQELTSLLYSGETNAGSMLVKAEEDLRYLTSFDEQFKAFGETLAEARQNIEEIGRTVEAYLNDLQFDPERMEFLQRRIGQIEFLLKKYQKISIEELILLHKEIAEKLGHIDRFDEKIEQKKEEIERLRKELLNTGSQLTRKRREKALQLQDKITEILNEIGMPQAVFRVECVYNEKENGAFEMDGRPVQPIEHGFDRVIFQVASNTGEAFKPLQKIASGGEISRIMLALKSVMAQSDATPTLVFDEIDAGISGKIAQIVGRKMAGLAKSHQIICITHLPQIASFAHAHYRVQKSTEEKRTRVEVIKLNDEEHIEEIAILLGGQTISDQARENARHLIVESLNYS